MTTTMEAAAPLTELLVTFFNALYADCRGVAWALAGRGQQTTQRLRIPVGQTITYLPPRIISELEFETTDEIRLCVATGDDSGKGLDLGAVFATIPLPPSFDNHFGWVVPEETERAARTKLEAFPLRPSIVLDQVFSLAALWLLERPLRIDTDEGLALAERLQLALAEAVGGDTGETEYVVPRASVSTATNLAQVQRAHATSPMWPALRLPGSRTYERGGSGHLVTFETLRQARYSIAEIEKALAPKPTKKKESK